MLPYIRPSEAVERGKIWHNTRERLPKFLVPYCLAIYHLPFPSSLLTTLIKFLQLPARPSVKNQSFKLTSQNNSILKSFCRRISQRARRGSMCHEEHIFRFLNTPAKLTVYGKEQKRERQAGRLVPTKEIPQVVVLLIDYGQGSVIKGKSVRLRVGRWWHWLEGEVK